MTWLAWRQHRTALLVGALVVAAICGLAVAFGVPMHHASAALDLPALRAGSPRADAQLQLFTHDYWSVGNLPWRVLVFLPVLVGVFIGAPLLSRELESGTYRLVWTQSVSRTRWLAVRLGLLAIATVALSLVLGGVLYWFFEPWAALGGRAEAFASIGPALAARTLFALALGVALGALIRRVVPAMAATAGVWLAAEGARQLWLRPHYLPPVKIVVPKNALVDTAFYLNQWWVGPSGHRLTGAQYDGVAQRLAQRGVEAGHWLAAHGYTLWASVQPDSRFWAFQGIEVALLCALSAALAALTFWLVRRNTA
jgi:hypothetical protein